MENQLNKLIIRQLNRWEDFFSLNNQAEPNSHTKDTTLSIHQPRSPIEYLRALVKMLEYFTSKKVKKHHDEKKGGKEKETMVKTPPPLLNDEDEAFLTRIVSAEGTPPPLPSRPNFGAEAGDSTANDAQMVVHDGREDHEHHRRHSHKSAKGEDHHRRHSAQSVDKGKGKEKDTEVKKENKFTGFLGRTFTKRVCLIMVSIRYRIYG
jgi:hypothetical protein